MGIEQTFERQYVPIEPGFLNFGKGQKEGRSCGPIEPESAILKPYKKMFKNCLMEKGGKSFLKNVGFMAIIPGSIIYFLNKLNDVKREIAQEKGEEFFPANIDKNDRRMSLFIEGVKIFGAYHLSSKIANYIW